MAKKRSKIMLIAAAAVLAVVLIAGLSLSRMKGQMSMQPKRPHEDEHHEAVVTLAGGSTESRRH